MTWKTQYIVLHKYYDGFYNALIHGCTTCKVSLLYTQPISKGTNIRIMRSVPHNHYNCTTFKVLGTCISTLADDSLLS